MSIGKDRVEEHAVHPSARALELLRGQSRQSKTMVFLSAAARPDVIEACLGFLLTPESAVTFAAHGLEPAPR
jgi:hypothetical protein